MNKRNTTIVIVLSCIFGALLITIIVLAACSECLHENFETLENDFITNPNTIDPNKIHIFMSFDQKYADLIGNNCAKINKLYADKYKFNFHKFISPKHKGYAPHYNRYFDLQTLMNKYPDDHYFIYMDSDAITLENKHDIRKWLSNPNSPTNVIFANEMNFDPLTKLHSFGRIVYYGISFSSGIFIIKNNNWSKKFVDNVLTNPNCKHNKRVNFCFDQTCISEIYKQNKHNEHQHIKVIPKNKAIQHYKHQNEYPDILMLHTISGPLNKPTYLQTMEPTLKPYK